MAADPTVNCLPSAPSTPNTIVALQVDGRAVADSASDRVKLAAFEAAWVESHVNNCGNGDRDSVGVFQQRANWGSVDARETVATAADAFLARAESIDASSGPSVTAGQIAQQVQRSANPTRYDQAQGIAAAIEANAAVTNGGGTHMIGSGAYMDVSSSGQVYAWNSRYLGGSPTGYTGRFTDAKVTAATTATGC